jgi:hypothetical protein
MYSKLDISITPLTKFFLKLSGGCHLCGNTTNKNSSERVLALFWASRTYVLLSNTDLLPFAACDFFDPPANNCCVSEKCGWSRKI